MLWSRKDEFLSFTRLWVRTSTTLAQTAEERLIDKYLPDFCSSSVYFKLKKYGIQHINTICLKKEDEEESGLLQKDKAVVFTHGFGGGAALFYRTLDAMKEKCEHIYAIDWLGMGRSSRPSAGYIRGYGYPQRSVFTRNKAEEVSDECIDFFVESLELWREAMNINKLQLVGHSLGGYLSTHYALRYPQNVDKLILLSPVGVPDIPDKTEEPADWVKQSPNFIRLVRAMWSLNFTPQSIVRGIGPWGPDLVRKAVRRRFKPKNCSDLECDILADYLYHITADKPSGEYALNALLMPVTHSDKAGIYARKPLASEIHKLKIPVLFMFGDRDWMFHEQVQDLVEAQEHCSLEFIDNAGHHVYFDNPEQFNEKLKKILAEN